MTCDENNRRTVSGCQFPLEYQATRVPEVPDPVFRIPGIPQPTQMRLLEVPRTISGWTALRVHDSRHPPRRRWGRRVHCTPLDLSGIVKQTVAPCPSLGATQSRP
jgi:hypothetical protein